MKPYLLTLLLVTFLSSASQAEDLSLSLPSLKALHIQRTVQAKGSQGEIVIYMDPLTGESSVFSSDGSSTDVISTFKKTHLLQKITRKKREWISEDFESGTMVALRPHGLKDYEIVDYKLQHNKWEEVARRFTDGSILQAGPDLRYQCNPPASDTELDKRLADFQDIVKLKLGGSYKDDWVPVQPNVVVNESCRESYDGGLQALVNDFNDGLNKGLQCMVKIWQDNRDSKDPAQVKRAERLRGMVRMVMGNFDSKASSKFKINCGSEGYIFGDFTKGRRTTMRANLVGHGPATHPPGVIINTNMLETEYGKNHKQLQSSFFHEMLHHAGYFHNHDVNTNFDVVYQLQRCCFENVACDQVMSMDHGQPYKVRTGRATKEEDR